MWKSRAATLGCILAAAPLLGCTGSVTTASQPVSLPSPVSAQYPAPPRVYRASRPVPAAVLVVLPGAGTFGDEPAFLANDGLDVVTPPAAAFYRLAAEHQQALAQMIAAAQRLAAAPVWVMGPPPEVDAALAAPGVEQISGVIESVSVGSSRTCSEGFSYFDPGTGARPQVKVRKSGNCTPGAAFSIGGPTIAPALSMTPRLRPNAPRVIDASAASGLVSSAAQRAAVERLAELIEAVPPS